jgi:glucose/arabinose dehydrogenase
VLGTDGKASNERVLVGKVSARSCSKLPATADCLPSDRDHDGAQLAFAHDGTIFLSAGDGGGYDESVEPTALRAQNVDSLSGKVLHITRNGKGVAGNPFAGPDLDANRAKVWALGLRNPFRLALSPSGIPIVADVGADYTEEVDAATRGANLGWPCWEGERRHLRYAATPLCKTLYASPPAELKVPLASFPHPDGESITGGDFGPTTFPAATRGAYFVGDWARGWLRTIRIASTGASASAPRPFATHLPGPTAIHRGPGGALYYAGLNAGEIRRIGPVQ